MKKLRRIAIWGPPSSGKSSLAVYLGKQIKIPVYHSDIYLGIEWDKIQNEILDEKVFSLIKKREWLIDGNFAEFRKEVLRRAQLIIILDLPFYILAFRLLTRTISAYSRFKLSSTDHFHKITYNNNRDVLKNEFINGLRIIINFKRVFLPYLLNLIESESAENKILIVRSKFNNLVII
ncbi:MAG: hypothetical protein ACW981_20655 [Candidatus Hodarchaeales archaeon]|jgi:cytidylate kinase